MPISLRLGLAIAVALTIIPYGTGSAQPVAGQDDDIIEILGEDQAALMQIGSWPEEDETVIGYTFVPDDYAVLTSYEVQSDEVTVFRGTRTTDGGSGSMPSWDEESQVYRISMSRKLLLTLDESAVEVEIVVAPDSHGAKRILALDVSGGRQASGRKAFSVWGSDFGVDVGQIAILHDDAREVAEDWDGQSSEDMSFIQNNILVNLKKSASSSVSLTSLADSMVAEILEQEEIRTTSGLPLSPTLELTISQTSIDFPAMDVADEPTESHSIELTVAVSDWSGESSRYAFTALKGHPAIGIGDDGKVQYDESRTTYDPSDDPDAFDNVSNPSEVSFHRTTGSSETSDWHIVVVMWGDNLVPATSFQPVNIVRGQ